VRSPPTPFKKGGIKGEVEFTAKEVLLKKVELKACGFPLGKGGIKVEVEFTAKEVLLKKVELKARWD
jgi:hypothetical protein